MDRLNVMHGEDIAVQNSQKPCGKMYGVGWHQSMEEGKTLAFYAPNSCAKETIDK